MGALEGIDQQHLDDDSSEGGFDQIIDENLSINEDESSNTSSDSDEPVIDLTDDHPTAALAKSSSSSRIYEVAKLSYQDFFIGIFSDNQEEPRRFFFEPIVLLDPATISIESDHILKQKNLIRFKIRMWTKELRSRVLDRLRFLYFDVELDDISVMPYEELKLIVKPGSIIHQSGRLVEDTINYNRLSESIPFYFICDSEDSATILADYLRRNTELTLERCQLALECDGLAISSRTNLLEMTPSDRPRTIFNVSTLPEEKGSIVSDVCKGVRAGLLSFINSDPKPLSDLTKWLIIVFFLFLFQFGNDQDRLIKTLVTANQNSTIAQDTQGQLIQTLMMANKNSANVVPVFSVMSTYGSSTNNLYIKYSTSEFKTETKHADFDLRSGIFTVKTAGIYQLNFDGHVRLRHFRTHHFELRVDGKRRAVSYISSSSEGYHQVHLSALLQLHIGEKVGVFRIEGLLHGRPDSDFTSTFSGVLFSRKFT